MIELKKPKMMAGQATGEIVGLDVGKVMREGEVVEVQFWLTRKLDGTKVYPNPFYIARSKAMQFHKEVYKGRTLVMIPLHEFREGVRR
jgi:hypothetical protein